MKSRKWLADKKILLLLIMFNMLGSIYGFYWYKEQLTDTPGYLWIFTPDCPLFSLAFVFVLIGFWLNKRNHNFEVIVWTGLIKYGVWTVFVISMFFYAVFKHHLQISDQFLMEEIILLISHIGMFLEGIILTRYLKISMKNILISVLWFLLSDIMDYGMDVHPWLPFEPHYHIIKLEAIVSTLVLGGILFLIFVYKQNVTKNKRMNI